MSPPQFGLIFDVDGVIADTESVNARASIQAFEEVLGLTGVRREDFERGLGRGAAAYVKAAAAVHQLDLTGEQVEALTAARQDNFLALLRAEPLSAYPGVLELMEAARAREDIGVAIATSSTREKSRAVLESVGVPFREMVYVTGSDVTHKKPHPELFEKAASRLGVGDPGRCVVIEDAPTGVEAAHNAGCRSIAVSNSVPAEKLAAAELVVASLEEVGLADVLALAGR